MSDEPTTPIQPDGKLLIDFPSVDDKGNTRIVKGEKVRPDAKGAQDGDKTPNRQPQPDQPAEPVAPKMFNEEEVNQRLETIKGGHKGTVDKMRQEIERLRGDLSTAQQQALDKEYDNWLRALEESGDDKNSALAKAVAQRDKETRRAVADFEKTRQETLKLKKELDEAGKVKFVYDTIKKYELGEDYVETLSNLDDRWEIAAKAAELSLEKVKAAAVAPTKTDKGGGKPVQRDLSKMPLNERLGRAMEGEFS